MEVTDAPRPPPSARDEDDRPILLDPYQGSEGARGGGGEPWSGASAPPNPRGTPRAGLSGMALTSLLSAVLLGPVGAILAIVFGWYARREIERAGTRRSGYGMATVGGFFTVTVMLVVAFAPSASVAVAARV